MVGDKTIQRILPVGRVTIIQIGVFRIHTVIYSLCVCLQIVHIINSMSRIHFVPFDKCRIPLHSCTYIICLIRAASGSDIHTLVHRVFTTMIRFIDILIQRVSQTGKLQGCIEEFDIFIFLHPFRKKIGVGNYHMVYRMHHSVFNRIVTHNNLGHLINIISHIVSVRCIRITGERQVSLIHIGIRYITVRQVGRKIGVFDDMIPCYRIAILFLELVDTLQTALMQICPNSFICRSKTSICSISSHHAVHARTLQYRNKITELLITVLQIVRHHLSCKRIIVLRKRFIRT